jgi:hypothetical protein
LSNIWLPLIQISRVDLRHLNSESPVLFIIGNRRFLKEKLCIPTLMLLFMLFFLNSRLVVVRLGSNCIIVVHISVYVSYEILIQFDSDAYILGSNLCQFWLTWIQPIDLLSDQWIPSKDQILLSVRYPFVPYIKKKRKKKEKRKKEENVSINIWHWLEYFRPEHQDNNYG